MEGTTLNTIVGVFDTPQQAQRAVLELKAGGFDDEQIGVLSRSDTGQVGGKVEPGGGSTATGAATGAAAGAGIGALWGLGILAGVLPGIGPVEQIKRQDGRWVVVTPKGIIVSMRDRRYFEHF